MWIALAKLKPELNDVAKFSISATIDGLIAAGFTKFSDAGVLEEAKDPDKLKFEEDQRQQLAAFKKERAAAAAAAALVQQEKARIELQSLGKVNI